MFNVSDGLGRIPNNSSFLFMKKTEWHKMRWRKRGRELEGVALQYWRRHGGEIKLAGSACRECTIYKCDNHIIRLIWNSALKVTHDWCVQDFVEAKIVCRYDQCRLPRNGGQNNPTMKRYWTLIEQKKRIPLKCNSAIADSSQVPHQKLTIWCFFALLCFLMYQKRRWLLTSRQNLWRALCVYFSCHAIRLKWFCGSWCAWITLSNIVRIIM